MNLHDLGLSSFFLRQLDGEELLTLPLGRVATLHHEQATLLTATGPRPAVMGGRLRHAAELPAVGDWVVVDGDDLLRITRVLDRASVFRRVGPDDREQVVAANVDTVFVVTAMDADYSVRRVERYLAAVHAGGATPVVVLTKTDLDPDPLPRIRAMERATRGVPVVPCSVVDGQGRDALLAFVGPGVTAAFTGSSGVGKSSLVNWLAGAPLASTGAVRAADAKGRHTTTTRTLLPLPGGGVLLDTPGMRGFAPAADADLDAVFDDVTALAARCRFGDCAHAGEPGCAVAAALADGRLAPERLDAWVRLQREAAYAARQADAGLARVERLRWKRIGQAQRELEALRRSTRG